MNSSGVLLFAILLLYVSITCLAGRKLTTHGDSNVQSGAPRKRCRKQDECRPIQSGGNVQASDNVLFKENEAITTKTTNPPDYTKPFKRRVQTKIRKKKLRRKNKNPPDNRVNRFNFKKANDFGYTKQREGIATTTDDLGYVKKMRKSVSTDEMRTTNRQQEDLIIAMAKRIDMLNATVYGLSSRDETSIKVKGRVNMEVLGPTKIDDHRRIKPESDPKRTTEQQDDAEVPVRKEEAAAGDKTRRPPVGKPTDGDSKRTTTEQDADNNKPPPQDDEVPAKEVGRKIQKPPAGKPFESDGDSKRTKNEQEADNNKPPQDDEVPVKKEQTRKMQKPPVGKATESDGDSKTEQDADNNKPSVKKHKEEDGDKTKKINNPPVGKPTESDGDSKRTTNEQDADTKPPQDDEVPVKKQEVGDKTRKIDKPEDSNGAAKKTAVTKNETNLEEPKAPNLKRPENETMKRPENVENITINSDKVKNDTDKPQQPGEASTTKNESKPEAKHDPTKPPAKSTSAEGDSKKNTTPEDNNDEEED